MLKVTSLNGAKASSTYTASTQAATLTALLGGKTYAGDYDMTKAYAKGDVITVDFGSGAVLREATADIAAGKAYSASDWKETSLVAEPETSVSDATVNTLLGGKDYTGEYSISSTYTAGQVVSVKINGTAVLREAKEDIKTAGVYDETKWKEVTLVAQPTTSVSDATVNALLGGKDYAGEYSTTATYTAGQVVSVIVNGTAYLREAIADITTAGEYDSSKWKAVTLVAEPTTSVSTATVDALLSGKKYVGEYSTTGTYAVGDVVTMTIDGTPVLREALEVVASGTAYDETKWKAVVLATGAETKINQITKMTAAVNDVITAAVSTDTFAFQPVEVLQFKAGDTSKVTVSICTFDNSDESDFTHDSKYVTFDGTMHPVTSFKYSMSTPTTLGKGYFSQSDQIDTSILKASESIVVKTAGEAIVTGAALSGSTWSQLAGDLDE